MMKNSRADILDAISENKPKLKVVLPDVNFMAMEEDLLNKFSASAITNGSRVYKINNFQALTKHIKASYESSANIITSLTELKDVAKVISTKTNSNQEEILSVLHTYEDAHELEHIDLAILGAHFGVAENAALWLTNILLGERVLPFITQHLIVILNENEIVSSMNQAYRRIGDADYDYGVFISGPSKTADIEQSLVVGAHGSRSLEIFIIQKN
jgi:L-lactate dehydrogenase complex protein LldG